MAEVRKKVLEDKYNTSKIKQKKVKKAVDKKVVKKVSKLDESKSDNKSFFVKFRIFCHGVKQEFLKVHWTSKKDMIKYSIACIFFIIFCSLFFYLIDIIFAFVQSLFS